MLGDLAAWVQSVVESLGYVGVALLVVIENLFPPIPSEIVLPFAGFVAQRGDASVIVMIVAATIGSVVGALILYGVSAAIGPERLRRIVERFGRFLGVSPADLRRAEEWFDRRAAIAVFAGRCVPIIRSVVSVPAGFRRMTLVPFVTYTALGSAIWNVALIGAGAVLGDQWERVEAYVGYFQWIVLLVAAYFLVRFAMRIARSLRRR